jgi:hypothetical protein
MTTPHENRWEKRCVALGMFAAACWAEPLDEAIGVVQQSWGELGLNTAAHALGKQGRTIQIGHTFYESGIGTHASGHILVGFWGEYEAFEAIIGVQAQPRPQPGSVLF